MLHVIKIDTYVCSMESGGNIIDKKYLIKVYNFLDFLNEYCSFFFKNAIRLKCNNLKKKENH